MFINAHLVEMRDFLGSAAVCEAPVTRSASACEDRRITRSKRALRQALIALLEERGFDSITVNDLCDRADLNRGTFYNHFRDKENLLAVLEDEVMGRYRRASRAYAAHFACRYAGLSCGRHAAAVACRPLRLSARAERFPSCGVGTRRGCSLCATLARSGVREPGAEHLARKIPHDPTAYVDYYVAFYASAYLGIITRWIERGTLESSEDMARIAMRLFFIKPGESIEL